MTAYDKGALSPLRREAASLDAVAKAFFDERYYRLAHPDVDRAIRAGQFDSGHAHYVECRKRERRSIRRNLAPGLSTPRTYVFFNGAGDYLSGVKIRLVEAEASSYRLIVHRIGVTGVKRVVEVDVDREAEIYDGSGYVLWPPISRSKGGLFFARLLRLDAEHKPAGPAEFLLAETDAQVFSPPRSETATPPLMAFSPITQCNLNCIHCISRSTRSKVRELSSEVWRQFQDLAAAKQFYQISADYSGDILYAQGKPNGWLDRIIALEVGMRIDTHANNLTFELADKLIKSKLAGVNFSIDSFDPEDYPLIRRGALPLEKVLFNVARFMRMRNKRRPSLRTSLSLVLMRRNLSSMIPAIDFAALHGMDAVSCLHLMAFTRDMAEESAMLDLRAYRAAYEAAVAHARAKGVHFAAPAPIAKQKPRSGHAPCEFPWKGAMVTGDGDVRACCMPESVVGNLNEASLEQIWNGSRMQAFRAAVNTPNPPSPCGQCGFYRHENNFESYVPGLNQSEREDFVARVLAQF